MRILLTIVVMLSLGELGLSQQYIGKQKEIDQILSSIEKFSGYVMASNYDKIADSYTEDGKIFPNNREIIEGRALIKEYWKLPEGVKISYHKITPSEIKIKGKEANDYGYYEGRTQRSNGEEVSWKGKYVIVWKKVEKEWKMYLDIWNRVEN